MKYRGKKFDMSFATFLQGDLELRSMWGKWFVQNCTHS